MTLATGASLNVGPAITYHTEQPNASSEAKGANLGIVIGGICSGLLLLGVVGGAFLMKRSKDKHVVTSLQPVSTQHGGLMKVTLVSCSSSVSSKPS